MPSAEPFSQPVTLGLAPNEGPREFYYVFDLALATVVSKRFDIARLGMSMVQSALVDNSANMQAVTLQITSSNQVISVGPQRQLFIPILATKGAFEVTVASAGAVPVAIHFFNVSVAPIDYSGVPPTVLVSGGSVSIAGTAAVSVVNVPAVSQSGAWTVGATQSGAWTVGATQSGAWTVGATQSGVWTVQTPAATTRVLGAAGLLQVGPGRLWAVNVVVPGVAGFITDGGVAIMATPAAVGTYTFPGGFPFVTDLTAAPGAGQVLSVSWTT